MTATLTGWLLTGVVLAICEQVFWNGAWAITLIVWWGYLTVSVLMLLRLLIHSWASKWSRASLGVVWMFVGLGLFLVWARPLVVRAGDSLLLHQRPQTLGVPSAPDGSTAERDLTLGTTGRS